MRQLSHDGGKTAHEVALYRVLIGWADRREGGILGGTRKLFFALEIFVSGSRS